MATIEDLAMVVANRIYSGWETERIRQLESAAAMAARQQDRIAHKEERERCIKLACEVHCVLCPINKRCELIENGTIGIDTWNRCRCFDRVKIRKAIEEGGQE